MNTFPRLRGFCSTFLYFTSPNNQTTNNQTLLLTANRAPTTLTFTRASTVAAYAATTALFNQPHQPTTTKPPLCTAVPTSYLHFRLHPHTTAMQPGHLPQGHRHRAWTFRPWTTACHCLKVLEHQCLGPKSMTQHICTSAANAKMGPKSTMSSLSALIATIFLATSVSMSVSSTDWVNFPLSDGSVRKLPSP